MSVCACAGLGACVSVLGDVVFCECLLVHVCVCVFANLCFRRWVFVCTFVCCLCMFVRASAVPLIGD